MTDGSQWNSDELEQRLLEERRERDAAQRRAAQLAEHVDLWRTRAEERTERIKKLEAERDALRGPGGWLRRLRYRGPEPAPATEVEEAGDEATVAAKPLVPAVRCVTAVGSPDLSVAARALDTIQLDSSVSLMEADVVLVDAEGFEALPQGSVDTLIEWASSQGRPPLVVTGSTPDEISRWAQGVIDDSDLTGRFFDPVENSPITRDELDPGGHGSLVTQVDGVGLVGSGAFDISSSAHLALAARGVPFVDTVEASGENMRRSSVQHRRFAFERRFSEMQRFLDQIHIDSPDIRPTVAGILVSNRPEDAVRAIDRLRLQRVANFEAVVGCHGFSASVVNEAIDRLAAQVPVTVLEFDSGTTLGACLNRSISRTSAAVIAKMDDDDHYGPAYLVDAVHALEYSDAPIVGKGTSFTYLESEDRTVVRRPGNEERYYNGSPTGATLVWKRSLWEENPFAHRSLGEDLSFLRGARRLGHRIYVNSVYEFVYHRRRSGNTWQANDALFLEGAEPAWTGESPALADVPDLAVPG